MVFHGIHSGCTKLFYGLLDKMSDIAGHFLFSCGFKNRCPANISPLSRHSSQLYLFSILVMFLLDIMLGDYQQFCRTRRTCLAKFEKVWKYSKFSQTLNLEFFGNLVNLVNQLLSKNGKVCEKPSNLISHCLANDGEILLSILIHRGSTHYHDSPDRPY